eukprot:gene30861-53079_t
MNAPRVVAKGADLIAMKIRDVAKAHKVPVLQSPMLARALYAHAELDGEVPSALYTAVAQVLAYVYQLKAALKGQGVMPGEMPTPVVPPELDPHFKKSQWLNRNAAWAGGLAAPMLVITILSMMVLPLPPWLLDTFFTLNIALALVVMMVASYMRRPLDFSVFPTVLLLTTLLRLSLNVASTRVVLLEGHTGPGAAGAVIEAFGHFLIGGNFAVGLIVFAILVVINFVVITKGA